LAARGSIGPSNRKKKGLRMAKRATQEELLSQIGAWNRCHAVGTLVHAQLYPDRVHKTRTEAMVLFDQKAVIYLDGFNGYFDLNEVRPVGDIAPASSEPVVNVAPAKRIAVVFPGQGAQNKGMGKDLFAAFPELTRRADEILGYSLERLCLEDPDNQLNQTQYTQVALYVVNAFGYLKRKQQNDRSVEADFLLGHSLGEYNALLAAGVFDFETGLRLVIRRGELMGAAGGGAMAAVLRVSADRIREVLAQHGLDAIDLVNYNTPMQTVISGPTEAMARAVDVLSSEKILAMPLKVSAAFHSRYMREAQQSFAEFVGTFTFNAPNRPVIANATARPYERDRIAQTLSEQIASPVLWMESVRYVLGQGEVEFTEIGSTILTRMVTEISAEVASLHDVSAPGTAGEPAST
jgi:trans-AT polyketide synthase/acyltransferase/oxidoreductase domain-containing protein